MTATILPFQTRDAYNASKFSVLREDGTELTPAEIHEKLTTMAFGELSGLISKFRGTGRWNPVAEKHMRTAIDSIVKVCEAVAGVKVNGNGKTSGQTA